MRYDDFVSASLGGAFVGIVIFGLMLTVVDAGMSISDFVHRYQTILAGSFALVGALLTVFHLQRQILEDRNRRKKIALALLAVNLDVVSTYAENSMKLADLYRRRLLRRETGEQTTELENVEEVPSIDRDILDSLGTASATLDEFEGSAIADMLAWYQIQNIRLRYLVHSYHFPKTGVYETVITQHDALRYINEAAELSLKVEPLYVSARKHLNIESLGSNTELSNKIRVTLGWPDGRPPH